MKFQHSGSVHNSAFLGSYTRCPREQDKSDHFSVSAKYGGVKGCVGDLLTVFYLFLKTILEYTYYDICFTDEEQGSERLSELGEVQIAKIPSASMSHSLCCPKNTIL